MHFIKKIFTLLLCCVTHFVFAESHPVGIMPLPYELSWIMSQADLEGKGIALLPESFICPNSQTHRVYLATSVPHSNYSGAIYKFTFNQDNHLSNFAIYIPHVTASHYANIQKSLTQEYGPVTYTTEGQKNGHSYDYLNWGEPVSGYIGVTYRPDYDLLLIAYFPPKSI